jgi:hypothetical protein
MTRAMGRAEERRLSGLRYRLASRMLGPVPFRRCETISEIICLAVLLYLRFPLSRDYNLK